MKTPGYALRKNHISAWVGAVELGEEDILLIGVLDLGGRAELDRTILKGFNESAEQDVRSVPSCDRFLARGNEDKVISKCAEALQKKFGRGRIKEAPRVWCSWYGLFGWVNERIFLLFWKA